MPLFYSNLTGSNGIMAKFSSTNQPTNRKHHTGPYLTTILTKLLKTKIKSSDKEVMAALKESGLPCTKAAALMIRYLYNGLEGDTKAIEGIIDRLDGKVMQKTELSGEVKGGETRIVLINSKKASEASRIKRVEI